MKHLVLTSVAVAALLLSGCSKKNPEMDGSAMGESSLASRIQSEVSNVYFDMTNLTLELINKVQSTTTLHYSTKQVQKL